MKISLRDACEGAIAAYFLGLLQVNGGQSDKAVCEVSHRHLIFDRTKPVMCGLFGLTLTETSEVLFDDDAFFVDVFVEICITLYAATGIVSGIKIFSAAIISAFSEVLVVNRTSFWCWDWMLPPSFDWTAELHTVAVAFMPCAVEDHFEFSLAQRIPMWSKTFRLLCVSRIDRNECSAFHAVNDQVVEFAHIIGGVGDKHGAFFEFVDAFEFLDECFCNRCISCVAGKSDFDKRNALAR